MRPFNIANPVRKQAWSEHKRECKCLKRLQPRIPTDSVRLSARIIFKLLSQSESDKDELYSISDHQSHLEDMCDEKKEGLEHLCSTLQVYLSEANCDFSQLPPGLDAINLLARTPHTLPIKVQSTITDVGLYQVYSFLPTGSKRVKQDCH
ncbi:hypothetical protein E1301_Tti002983 [Triplophysa tibetana]|uniref:Uncharacterized protein n=1 Tax=Triplophysa tibetana TaxID=1572043 RepID=A0A5A9NPJ6_9TELE|nr:hypothetical protein E1301_Tti002983 [Triplophysa tibetana]